jgi:hypothetical protein
MGLRFLLYYDPPVLTDASGNPAFVVPIQIRFCSPKNLRT